MALAEHDKQALDEALARQGLRSTRQREHVFAVLLERRDHPSADEVFTRSKAEMPGISLATVYNCLETLVECGLVKQVNHERESTRYCPNLNQHAHFHDRVSGRVYDISLPPEVLAELKRLLPPGYNAENIEISFHGSSEKKSGADDTKAA